MENPWQTIIAAAALAAAVAGALIGIYADLQALKASIDTRVTWVHEWLNVVEGAQDRRMDALEVDIEKLKDRRYSD